MSRTQAAALTRRHARRVHGQRFNTRDVDIGLVQATQLRRSDAARAVEIHHQVLPPGGHFEMRLVQHPVRREVAVSCREHQNGQLRAGVHRLRGALEIAGNQRLEQRRDARLQWQDGALVERRRKMEDEHLLRRDDRRTEQDGHLLDGAAFGEHALYEGEQLLQRVYHVFPLPVLRLVGTSSHVLPPGGRVVLLQFLQG